MATLEELRSHPVGQYTDYDGVRLWYGDYAPGPFPGLPSEVQEGLTEFNLDTLLAQPRPDRKAQRTANEALKVAVKSVLKWLLPEHTKKHFVEVRDFAKVLWFAYCRAANVDRDTSLYIWQIMEPALLMHDYGHCGATLLGDMAQEIKDRGHPYKNKGPNVSLEWLSTLDMIRFSVKHGFEWPEIALQAALIESSTYAGKDALRKGFRNIPEIKISQLVHVMSLIMRIADVMINENPLVAFARGICVKGLERPADLEGQIDLQSPDAFDRVLNSQEMFYPHILELFDQLARVVGRDLTGQLGWRRIVEINLSLIPRIRSGKEPSLERALREMIANPEKAVKLRNR